MNAAATVAVAVLALALTGCGKDDDKGASSHGATDKPVTAHKGDDAKHGTASATPTSASPSPSRTKPAKKPGGSPTTPRATRAAEGSTPAPRHTPPKTQAPPARPGAPASVQGTWYSTVRDPNGKPVVMTVSGSSLSIGYQGKSCPGTINSSMAVTLSCQGETVSGGHAVVSGDGQKLTVNWPQGKPDQFVRP
ncbi:hypothetical protein VT50_0234925 [Streptomyces antioxidans]|uniref:Uncharacterized protein n=1 Tax=Streptomyces antioxidans TaxID=1507734 RepID=A0A1V4CUX1_9ACTN|nr:hypothetical protein [Streptomyces antioxidans]OPF71206.1 hypothetical protein VT50_0234925 [Streptomyces antioxidans]